MQMLGVDTVLKLAVMKQTIHPFLASVFVLARFFFLPSSGARCVPLLRNVHTCSGSLRAFYPRGTEGCFSEGKAPSPPQNARSTTYLRLTRRFGMSSAVCVCTHCMPVARQVDTAHPSRQVNDSEGIFQQCDSAPRKVARRVFGAERRNVTRSVVTVARIECNNNYCSCLIGAAVAGGGHDRELHG